MVPFLPTNKLKCRYNTFLFFIFLKISFFLVTICDKDGRNTCIFDSKPPGRFGTLFWKRLIKQSPPIHHVLRSIRPGNRKTLEEVRLYINICSLLGCFPNCKNVGENMKKMCTICLEKEFFIFYANVSFFFYFLSFFF